VLESGGGVTLATPVHDGYVLSKAMIKSPLAGEELTQYMFNNLASRGTIIRPNYMLNKRVANDQVTGVTVKDLPNATKSFNEYEVMVREQVCWVVSCECWGDTTLNDDIIIIGADMIILDSKI